MPCHITGLKLRLIHQHIYIYIYVHKNIYVHKYICIYILRAPDTSLMIMFDTDKKHSKAFEGIPMNRAKCMHVVLHGR